MKARWARAVKLVFQIAAIVVLFLGILIHLLIEIDWYLAKTAIRVEVGRILLTYKLRRAGVPKEMIREVSKLLEERALRELEFANPLSYLAWGVRRLLNNDSSPQNWR